MTADARAVALAADPAWKFTEDPNSAVTYASSRAAQADMEGRGGASRGWVITALALIDAADNPEVTAGLVLTGLAVKFGLA